MFFINEQLVFINIKFTAPDLVVEDNYIGHQNDSCRLSEIESCCTLDLAQSVGH